MFLFLLIFCKNKSRQGEFINELVWRGVLIYEEMGFVYNSVFNFYMSCNC